MVKPATRRAKSTRKRSAVKNVFDSDDDDDDLFDLNDDSDEAEEDGAESAAENADPNVTKSEKTPARRSRRGHQSQVEA